MKMKNTLKIACLVLSLLTSGAYVGAGAQESCPVFDFESKTVTLNSGYEMPISSDSGCSIFRPRRPKIRPTGR